MSEFKEGEIVIVKRPSNMVVMGKFDYENYVFAQKFSHEDDGIYYTYRDDGDDGVIGWKECRKNTENYEYHEGKA